MATALQTLIDAYIKRNANQEITGPVLNGVLTAISNALGTPFVGSDGYWYTYDAETGQFVKTDTPAQGETGPVGVTEAAATIDDQIGTPSVAVSLDGTRLDFAFRNLKGQKGDTGDAGITAAVVTVDAGIGTPSVDASITGTTLTLAFHNLKGETGAAAGFGTIEATVDDTTGTPAVVVTESGPDTAKNLSFAFSGLKGQKGDQGDTGVSADYPITIANNLTTDDPTAALAASQGVVLKGEIDQLGQEVNGADIPDTDITPTSALGYYYDISGSSIVIRSNGGSHYSGTIVDTSTPPSNGIDISGHVGKTIKVTMSSMSAGSSRKTIIAAQDLSVINGYAEETYTQDSGATTYSKSFVVPSGAKWLFWSAVGSLSSIVVVGEGHIDGLVDRIEDLESATETIAGDIATIEEKTGLLSVAHSANLFNKNDTDVVLGKFLTGNTFYTDANYNVSGYIPVNPGITYYGASGTLPFRFAEYYAADKSYLSGDNIPNGSQFTTPASCAFVRVTFYADRYATAQVATTSTDYVAYKVFLETVQGTGDNAIATLKDVNGDRGDALYGKKWVACGDSFTHGDFTDAPEDDYHIEDGLYQGQLKVYPFIIGNRTKMVVINEAVNGSTMTYVGGNRSEFSTPNGRYTQIPADADYITLKFGINDDTAHASAPIGTIDDNTNSTFYGAWNIVMDYLIRNHPQAKIGIIVTNGSQLPYVNAIIAIAEKWGVSYLNEATDPKCSFMFRSNRTDVVTTIRDLRNNYWYVDPDLNNHPNAKAHEYESTVVEAWLRTL